MHTEIITLVIRRRIKTHNNGLIQRHIKTLTTVTQAILTMSPKTQMLKSDTFVYCRKTYACKNNNYLLVSLGNMSVCGWQIFWLFRMTTLIDIDFGIKIRPVAKDWSFMKYVLLSFTWLLLFILFLWRYLRMCVNFKVNVPKFDLKYQLSGKWNKMTSQISWIHDKIKCQLKYIKENQFTL